MGIQRLTAEASGASVPLGHALLTGEAVRDTSRASLFARNFGRLWLGSAQSVEGKAGAEAVAKAAKAASAATQHRVGTIGVSETSEAFNTGRAKYLREATDAQALKVWDATLDKRTCPQCSLADGTIVFAYERFPLGEPGAVHARCRCSWQLIGTSERYSRVTPPPAPSSGSRPRIKVAAPVPKPATAPRSRAGTFSPQVAAPGYRAELSGSDRKVRAYERMLGSKVVPQAVRDFRGSATLKRLQGGIDEADLHFSRIGYRAPISPYAGVTGQQAINDIATGRALPPGSSRPLPPITITKYPRDGRDAGPLSLTDGRHRLEAAQKAGATEIRARIRFYNKDLDVVWEGDRIIPLPKADPTNPHGRMQD